LIRGHAQSRKALVAIPVQVREGCNFVFSRRYSPVLVLPLRSMASGPLSLPGRVSYPHSPGMKRLTPAATAASMYRFWLPDSWTATVMMTTSWSANALVRDSTELRSALRTSTPSGKVEVELSRETAVTLNPAARRACTTGTPKAPEACGGQPELKSVGAEIVLPRLRRLS
jgi:hypothetical protein